MKRIIAALTIACGLSSLPGCITPPGGNPFWPPPFTPKWNKKEVPQATIPKVKQPLNQQQAEVSKPGEGAFSTKISD